MFDFKKFFPAINLDLDFWKLIFRNVIINENQCWIYRGNTDLQEVRSTIYKAYWGEDATDFAFSLCTNMVMNPGPKDYDYENNISKFKIEWGPNPCVNPMHMLKDHERKFGMALKEMVNLCAMHVRPYKSASEMLGYIYDYEKKVEENREKEKGLKIRNLIKNLYDQKAEFVLSHPEFNIKLTLEDMMKYLKEDDGE